MQGNDHGYVRVRSRQCRSRHAAWKAGDAKALTGVPVTVKDLIFVAGTEAKGGAPALDGFVPDVDAAVVTAVKDAGAIITCKTTTCESGYKLTADSPVSG